MQFSAILSIFPLITAVLAAPPVTWDDPKSPLPRLECSCVCGTDAALSVDVTKKFCEKSIAGLAGFDTSIMSVSPEGACAFFGALLGSSDAFIGIMDGMKQHCPVENSKCQDIKCSMVTKDGVDPLVPPESA